MVRSSLAATLATAVPMLELERRMKRAGGVGIIPLELAGTPERAQRILERWGDDGLRWARWSLVLDYPFLAAYTSFNVAAHRALGSGRAMVAAQVAAGACDAVENAALLGYVTRRDERLPAVARAFASVKFALLGLGWVTAIRAVARRAR